MRKRVIALGFFDGVHLGHGALLSRTAALAKENGFTSAALTFEEHPLQTLKKEPVPLINTTSERVGLIKRLYDIEEVLLCDFDISFSRLSCAEFVRKILIDKYNAAHVVAGYDYRFGQNAAGGSDELKRLCEEYGLGVSIIEKIELSGITVSSTYIRKLISDGDMRRAARFLGHPHCMEGEVLHGHKIGTKLGIPTINLKFEENIQIPRLGVYVTSVALENETRRGATSVGIRPTVCDNGAISVETHIIDYNAELYGKRVRIDFLDYLREEIRFNSIEELKERIYRDIDAARKYTD